MGVSTTGGRWIGSETRTKLLMRNSRLVGDGGEGELGSWEVGKLADFVNKKKELEDVVVKQKEKVDIEA